MSKINFIKTIIPKGVFKKQYELGSLMIYHIGEVLNEEMGAYDCYECSMAISSFNEEEVKSAFGEYVKDIKEVELAQAKQQKLAEIEAYDQSEAVNSFLLNGKARWLNVSKRQSIAYTAKILKEKGYDPINQIVGYILSDDPTYITNHNSARSLICKIDRNELLQVLVKSYLEL